MNIAVFIALGVVGFCLFIVLKNSVVRQDRTLGIDPPETNMSDDEHSLEWRYRYLLARITYLENKIEKKARRQDRSFPSLEALPDADLETQNEVLESNVRALEAFLNDLKSQ